MSERLPARSAQATEMPAGRATLVDGGDLQCPDGSKLAGDDGPRSWARISGPGSVKWAGFPT